jgi:hypothetical protein
MLFFYLLKIPKLNLKFLLLLFEWTNQNLVRKHYCHWRFEIHQSLELSIDLHSNRKSSTMDVSRMMSTDKDFLKKTDLMEMIFEKIRNDALDLQLENKIRILYDEIQIQYELDATLEVVLKEIVEKKKLFQKEKEVNSFFEI